MRTNPNDSRLAGVIRPLHDAAPEDSAADLLRLFVEQHIHIALVRDPQGRTLGIVALEDLVEELVGEIEDEFDRLPRLVHAFNGGTWIVGGGVKLAEVNARLGATLAPPQETLSAWLTRRLGQSANPATSLASRASHSPCGASAAAACLRPWQRQNGKEFSHLRDRFLPTRGVLMNRGRPEAPGHAKSDAIQQTLMYCSRRRGDSGLN